MARLKILASGKSPPAQANARGKLFEKLMADVLRHLGYKIDQIANVNYSGMEIDIEGSAIATGIPLYAECKCYETEIDSVKLQAFYGKYMTRWIKDKRCQALFIALPSVNSHAKGFYRDNCENNRDFTFRIYDETGVINAIFEAWNIKSPSMAGLNMSDVGMLGDVVLLYTDKGLIIAQYVIPRGGAIATKICLFDIEGNLLSDKTTIDYLTQLWPELSEVDVIFVADKVLQTSNIQHDIEEIVEVRGSTACFEYQFPAAPEHFVGRYAVLKEIDLFANNIIEHKASSRGILFTANSGWGKSSIVLSSVDRLLKNGHFALAIDSRSASSALFILKVIDYSLKKFGNFSGLIDESERPSTISGFEGAISSIVKIGTVLQQHKRALFIFLDQFENIFFLRETLRRIRDIFLKINDIQTNVVFGFSWKTDLIGLTEEFPFKLRDSISDLSNHLPLDTFSKVETTELLEKLSQEIKAPLRKDLDFFLSEFSQGYPWLLKKLCAHVKSQREAGVPQVEIANSLLNVEELFQEDLRGLTTEEEDTLRRIAKAAPIGVLELGEKFSPEIVQSLVHVRLLVRIGSKYDIYWDIFRDYLNSGIVPVQDNYMLRLQIGSIIKTTRILAEANSPLPFSHLQKLVALSEKSFYNILREIRLLGIAKVEDSVVYLQLDLSKKTTKDFDQVLREHLRNHLRRNRLVWQITEKLKVGNLSIDDIASLLQERCPYIKATNRTWKTYARIFMDWLNFSDLAIYEDNATLVYYTPGAEIRERRLILPKRRGGLNVPNIQYGPVEKVLIRIVEAVQSDSKVIDWSGFKKSTVAKALGTLEDLGFISRKPKSILVLQKAVNFVAIPEERPRLFAEGALQKKVFSTFIEILNKNQSAKMPLSQLGAELKSSLGAEWKDDTAITNVKIMLDWARHTRLAPGVFSRNRRSKQNGSKRLTQLTLL